MVGISVCVKNLWLLVHLGQSQKNQLVTARILSLGQGNIFSSVCQEFCPQGGVPQCMLGYHTPLGPGPPEQTHPPRPGTPHPPDKVPLGADTPQTRPPRPGTPLHSACWEIRSTSGRYASYWNAILSINQFSIKEDILFSLHISIILVIV